MADLVTYHHADSISTLTMDDGKANVLSPAMQSAIHAGLDRAAADGGVVILAGRPGRFSAGFDLSVLSAGGAEATGMLIGGFRLSERMLSFPLPIVVACGGHALAMGSFLMLSADYRIGVSGEFKIGANEVAIGLTMPAYGVEICRQRLTPSHFSRSVITAEIFNPHGAVEAGYLDEVVAPEALAGAARAKAAQLATLDLGAHDRTKQRARAHTLAAIRSAIEQDEAELTAFLPG